MIRGFYIHLQQFFVIAIYQLVKPKMKGKYYKLKESLSFCIFIQIGMLPLIIYFQYEAPAFSFLANVAAVPLATCCFYFSFSFDFFAVYRIS